MSRCDINITSSSNSGHRLFFHLSLSDDVIQGDEAAANRLLLLLFESDLNMSDHGEQSYGSLVMLQTFLTD